MSQSEFRPYEDVAALIEPSPSRLYMHTSHTASMNGGATIDILSGKDTSLSEMTDVWETQPSTTSQPIDGLTPPAVRDSGCLAAISTDQKNGVSICRELRNTAPVQGIGQNSQDVALHLWMIHDGKIDTQDYFVPHSAPNSYDFGDLLRMTVKSNPRAHTTQVLIEGAGLMLPNQQPIWIPVGQWIQFAATLNKQGLYATNDVLFVGTRHNGILLRKRDFGDGITKDIKGNDLLVDLSF